MRCWCDLDAILMRSWCDLDAILMRSWCDLDAILMRCYVMKNIILRVYQKLKSHKNTCFRRKIACSLRKSILLDENHYSEGVSDAKKSEKYLFSTQNYLFSSKKASFWMKNIILKVYQKIESQKITCFRRKITRSLRKKHNFEWKISFRRCIRS